ncbi:MAG: hypothetical protein ACJAWL_001161 [Motiliproteus sp.]|jgi:hypothetical protein
MTPTQLECIEQQLGRPPRGLAEIAYQSPDGIPMVLRMHSLVDDKPFPTLYWLCSTDLDRAISRIESTGWIKQIEQELQLDTEFKERYLQNHRDYVATRAQYLSPELRQRIAELGFSEVLERYGIGGISQWDRVRCLHMQYAHYLCTEGDNRNVIGARMEQEFSLSQLKITR